VFENKEGKEIVVLYRQMDGYPSGHGEELSDFLMNIKLVNGLPINPQEKLANGMGCLAAQVVAHFKKEVGRFYLYPAGTRDVWEDYIYFVRERDGQVEVECKSV